MTTSSKTKKRVLIVDDHPIVRKGLGMLIAEEPDMEVCGEAEDVKDALERVDETKPDIAVVDISLKSGHGIDLIEKIKSKHHFTHILVSSMHEESLFAERALRAGAMGYISKDESPECVIDAIRQILRGEIYLSSRMTNRILRRVGGPDNLNQDPIETLTNREFEVFEMFGRGLSTKQIAGRLGLSPKTIESHREKIKEKLSLANSSEFVRLATQWVLQKK